MLYLVLLTLSHRKAVCKNDLLIQCEQFQLKSIDLHITEFSLNTYKPHTWIVITENEYSFIFNLDQVVLPNAGPYIENIYWFCK